MRWQRRVFLGTILALMVALAGIGAVRPNATDAQARTFLLTAVGSDGILRALDGDRWVDVWADVGHGATVTALAWHPSRPEVLLVRRTLGASAPVEPSYSLVRLDLSTNTEETILGGIGPQAQILGPSYAPDGRSAIARVECCLARELVRFGVPPADTAPTQGPARAFLDPAFAEDTDVNVGSFTLDGRLLIGVSCCMGDVPSPDPTGLYLVAPDLKQSERIAGGIQGTPLGLGPDGAWVAVLDESSGGDGPALVAVDLPAGTPRMLVASMDPPLASVGEVAPDGRIAVAQRRSDAGPWDPLDALWIVQPDGTMRNTGFAPGSGLTAFAWAHPDVVSKARVMAAAIGPTPRTTTAPPPATTRAIKVFFSRHPESDADFAAVFSVDRTAPDEGVAAAALRALIAGPTEAERAAGYFSELGEMLQGTSTCGGPDVALRIEGGTATVRFCRLVASAGIGQDARVQSAIEATLRQFATVQRVRILTSDGDCLFDMSGENRCLAT